MIVLPSDQRSLMYLRDLRTDASLPQFFKLLNKMPCPSAERKVLLSWTIFRCWRVFISATLRFGLRRNLLQWFLFLGNSEVAP